jgi:signal peptidase I
LLYFVAMSETAAANTPEASETPATEQPGSPGKNRRLWAAVLSAVVPGSGQILVGAKRKGFVLLLAFGVFVIAMWPGRVLATYAGLVLSVFPFLALVLYATCNALLGRSQPAPSRPSRWWLLLFIPVAILSMSLEYRLLGNAAGLRSFSLPSTSMEKTLLQGDQFIVDMHYYHHHSPAHGDLVVFRRSNIFMVKRIIAVGGDTIEANYGTIYLNGEVLTESYVEHIQGGSILRELNTFGPITVPVGQYFVMGDNRDMSYDSRFKDFGVVSEEMISGKPLYVYQSGRAGKVLR